MLYFADSLGCLDSKDINFIAECFNNEWKNNFGFHAHNKLCTNNTLTLQNNLKWIDATIKGMERGLLQTEIILSELNNLKHIMVIHFFTKTLNNFAEIQQKFDWGPSIYYHFAQIVLTSTYVQTLSDPRYNVKDYDKILTRL